MNDYYNDPKYKEFQDIIKQEEQKMKCNYCKNKDKALREFDNVLICDDCVNELYYDEEGNLKYKDDEIPAFIND